jgi:transposase
MGCIIKRKFGEKTYYYFSQSVRVKGAGPGGKSKVKTEQIYLGSAEDVRGRFLDAPKPHTVRCRSYGIEAAAVRISQKIDLVGIIDRHVAKRRQGLSVGQYLLVGAINRLVRPTSKNGIAHWCQGSALPDLMHIDTGLLKSQNFWDAFDTMISEPSPKKNGKPSDHGPLVIDDSIILDIEQDIWNQVSALYHVPLDAVIYDATNYFTHFDPLTPSELARFARSKDGKKNKRCVGMAIGQTLEGDLPLFNLIYAANCHDARLFPTALHRLSECLTKMNQMTKGVLLVMDKGNNSRENIQEAVGEHGFTVVGSLVPSHVPDLMGKQLRSFTQEVRGLPAYREDREVFGLPATVVVTFNESLRKRQAIRLEEKLKKAEDSLRAAISKHGSKESKAKLQQRLDRIRRESGVGRLLRVEVGGRRHKTFIVERRAEELRERRRLLGKTVLFTTDRAMSTEEVVLRYRQRDRVEKTFRLSKGPEGVPFRPIHHWTDSKIRVFSFTCVLALLIWRLLVLELRRAGLPFSDRILRMELQGIQEVVLLYSASEADRRLSECSEVQRNILSILGLKADNPSRSA